MFDRRAFLSAKTALSTVLGVFFSATQVRARTGEFDVEPRGSEGRLERMPTLEMENIHDFTSGIRRWHSANARGVAGNRVQKIFEEQDLDPKAEMPIEEVVKILEDDPVITTASRVWLSNQQVTWKSIQDHYHSNANLYLAEMESYDKRGPGTLELNPGMDIPDYTKWEIHIQPGGYVGDPFAGHLYHYGTNSFYYGISPGGNDQDQIHITAANRLPLPEDGKVKRILDIGCGVGQFTVALKERFPDAEVWGLDIGGPMVRYAHMRAVDVGVDVNFVQRLAEDTKFPDDHFDIVTSYIMHHEVTADAARSIFREAHRIARPGGYYYPIDFRSGRQAMPHNAYMAFSIWNDHRWNSERWSLEFRGLDFEGEMEKAGFWLNPNAKAALPGFGIRHAIKKA